MMREPWFWRDRSRAARAIAASLEPTAALYDAARRWRQARIRPERPPVPVICVGAVSLGGAGKTPFVRLLREILASESFKPHFLTRGYGGRLKGPIRVIPSVHDAIDVGDEALLLAADAPTWLARARPAGARAAAEAGADVILMDDGFQNASLQKALSLLLVEDGGEGEERRFPAGPLREPVAEAEARAGALIHVLRSAGDPPARTASVPQFSAWLEPCETGPPARVFAFCGIARPERFFYSLADAGFEIAGRRIFADHHPYTDSDMDAVSAKAKRLGGAPITTEKDFVRLPWYARSQTRAFKVRMRTNAPGRLAELVKRSISEFHRHG